MSRLLIAHAERGAQQREVQHGVLVELALAQRVPQVLAEDLRRAEPRAAADAAHHACTRTHAATQVGSFSLTNRTSITANLPSTPSCAHAATKSIGVFSLVNETSLTAVLPSCPSRQRAMAAAWSPIAQQRLPLQHREQAGKGGQLRGGRRSAHLASGPRGCWAGTGSACPPAPAVEKNTLGALRKRCIWQLHPPLWRLA